MILCISTDNKCMSMNNHSKSTNIKCIISDVIINFLIMFVSFLINDIIINFIIILSLLQNKSITMSKNNNVKINF